MYMFFVSVFKKKFIRMNDWYDEIYGIVIVIFYENIYFIIEGWKKF